jgi:hypothetical protein
VFGIVGDLRTVAWRLGVAASSRGALIDTRPCRRSSTAGSPGMRPT